MTVRMFLNLFGTLLLVGAALLLGVALFAPAAPNSWVAKAERCRAKDGVPVRSQQTDEFVCVSKSTLIDVTPESK